MKVDLEEYAHLDSVLHRWEPRRRLIGLMALAFAFAYVQDLRLLPAMVAVTIVFYLCSRIPLSFLVTRLSYPLVFFLILSIMLPFVSGTTIVTRIGPLAVHREGVAAVLLVLTRFVCILTLSLVLFASSPILTNIKAMMALGLPTILADMVVLSYRYLYEIAGSLDRMRTAMRLRGFRAHHLDKRSLGVLAYLSGSLLLRSYERSDRVYNAMILRGYGNAPRETQVSPAVPRDTWMLGLTLSCAVAFVVAQVVLAGRGA